MASLQESLGSGVKLCGNWVIKISDEVAMSCERLYNQSNPAKFLGFLQSLAHRLER
jgi:hypothetical protein